MKFVPARFGRMLTLGFSLVGMCAQADATTTYQIVAKPRSAPFASRSDACPCHTILYNFDTGPKGDNPNAPLSYLNGLLYGTTSSIGANGGGSVFSISPSGALTVVHAFGSGADGNDPGNGALLAANGLLYGTTGFGGSHGRGTIFSVSPNGAERVV